ncbi:MAG: methyltransferase domain-containing protein [Gemmataceae bacterium]|nr:methyltransferase domain-containing protein [Gemmataceae bacterium]
MLSNAFPLKQPPSDPAPLFELFRGCHATELLTAAVVHFQVFEKLLPGPIPEEELQKELELTRRAWVVFSTALKAFGLLEVSEGKIGLTSLAMTHLLQGGEFSIANYIGLAGNSPGVLDMVRMLKTDKPRQAESADEGHAFIFREGMESAMEKADSARRLTLSLAGRARNVAPVLAQKVSLTGFQRLLDVGAGSGLYAIALMEKNPSLQSVLWDGQEVLKVAEELVRQAKVENRTRFHPGDMFKDDVPSGADAILLSNVLHDWDVAECKALLTKLARSLPQNGILIIHDVFLTDALDGPLAIALYSASLFSLTEGRAYSAGEIRGWLKDLGMTSDPIAPTLAHCGAMIARFA